MMDKSKINLVIDALMFFCMMAMTGIGLLVKFVLLPGKDTWAVYGRKVELFLFGMDRHQWGTIHMIIAFVFLGLAVLHIILHWKMILSLYPRLIGSMAARRIIAVIIVIAGLFFVVFPFVLKPEVQELEGKGRHYRESIDIKNK
ncbi:MAG: DUF4405 domain-containing protein [Candidatus Brocadia sp. AMX2]|uniref:Flavinylation-associated cytochrome domain-containing protein n=1 Tax=Candidatus Brocadia sinica JPN1 TaxID=1197129 RepID=A0ABQ0JZ97_9BACT|nr:MULTISPECIES: DUF4405 domain-containing protein [Brocadia]MBC6931237.1 DUF4405 domain-containing protein [Candidatus Brocadia sp.]MBL1168592.1 DUF4405 domain-containing protein [Candidatus Brocadia sp. AMX1]MCK6467246.1 DUF4405 domain-containing protein [Candidatus Brocadia sinica]NOG40128.1 DUF4405 domain-containing protein [Planctomycetota bacterium]KAA0246062.1 MAG: DUF4405 domain-containing protein [Candidatus Brocadia sp. AMX2]